MSGSADSRLSIRLDLQGGAEARQQLEAVASTGEAALKRVGAAGANAGEGLALATTAVTVFKAGLNGLNGDMAVVTRQVEDFGRAATGLVASLRSGAGLAGAIGGVIAVAATAYTIFENWEKITNTLSSAMDTLTGRYRSTGEALGRANDLLREYNTLAETAIQRTARLAGESILARQAQNLTAQSALRGDIESLQAELERIAGGRAEAQMRSAQRRFGQRGRIASEDPEDFARSSGEILQQERDRQRERAPDSPEVQRLRLDIQEREARLRDLERWGRQFQGEYAASQEAVGSVLTPPPSNTPTGGRGTGAPRSAGMSAEERAALAEQRAQEREAAAQQRLAERQAAAEQRALEEQERRNQRVTDRIVDYGAERFADLFDKNGRGWKGMLEAFERTARLTFARIAAEAVLRPIIAPIVQGLGLGSLGNGNGGFANLFGGGSSGPGGVAQAGQAVSGGSGGLFSGFGSLLSSAAGGFSSFMAMPLFGQAAAASATNSALAAMPGGMLGPAAPSSLGLGATTVGSFLGSAALGAGLGMAGGSIAGGIRGTADPMPGAMIGTGLGMGIGFLVGGPVGMAIGGAIGGTAGGLFGPTRSGMAARSGGDVFLGVDDAGMLTITGARGKRWDQGAAVAEVQQQLDAINQQISARGLTFGGAGQAAVGFGAASGSPRELSMTALVGQLRSGNANQMTAFGTLAGRGGNLEQALQAADFVTQVFEPLSQAEKKTYAFTAAMEALTKTYDEAIAKARDLGLSESGLTDQRAARVAKLEADRARDVDIIDRTLGARRAALAGDTRSAGLTQFDLRAEAEARAFKDQLLNLGFDEAGQDFARRMVRLEQIVADERLAVMRQFDEQMRGISQGLLEQLTLGDLGGLSPAARFGAGMSLLSNAQGALADGATVQELQEFARVAQTVLPVAKDFLGVSSGYAELVAGIAGTLRTAAPGSDPANLGALLEAQVNGADRLELAVISTGQAQTSVLESVLSELRRLTAQNEALLRRAAS